ncbi:MAG: hypothetical protein B5766_00330 [Candidatus Lumbricidophila eiseniae]|uniref:Glutaredoxin-like protein NrdH n=1 Tax=Candidatus Lumbricidiphila eiseniae TaxID=1969409 RepID=A0A2A6FUD6_9MICO|nr:MAG: hypothetical protein B5766_00330 [Candidatus Lumbricidophila eiseniae]
MSITVYTKPGCVQCDMTKRLLDRRSVAYTSIDLSVHPEDVTRLSNAGFKTVPIIEIDGQPAFAGFQPDRITTLIKRIL